MVDMPEIGWQRFLKFLPLKELALKKKEVRKIGGRITIFFLVNSLGGVFREILYFFVLSGPGGGLCSLLYI